MKVICIQCNRSFEKRNSEIAKSPRHFCSRSCSARCNNFGKCKNSSIERVCNKCYEKFSTNKVHHSRVRCKDCSHSLSDVILNTKAITLGEIISRKSVSDKHPSWKYVHVRNLNRFWNSDLRKLSCANCGYDKHVELAHRKAISSFPLTATLGEINSPNNNIQLCPNCHWEFDKGLLTL